jgi:hypothetical protein
VGAGRKREREKAAGGKNKHGGKGPARGGVRPMRDGRAAAAVRADGLF